MELGERIRQARKEKNLGLRETARQVGISATYLSRIENGEVSSAPSEKRIRRLSQVLEIPFSELMHLARRVPLYIIDYLLDNPDILDKLGENIKT